MKTKRECPVCNILYFADVTRLKHGRQTTCSRDCSYKLRAIKLKNSVEIICACCKKKFSRCISQIKKKNNPQFCSSTCHYKGRTLGISKRIITKPYKISAEAYIGWKRGAQKTRKKRMQKDNYRHTEFSKAKLSAATSKAIANGKINTVSNLEKKIIPILDSFNIQYTPQFPIRDNLGRFSCVFDFFIPAFKIVIEVNGTFYHSDPRFYPNGPVHAIQKHNAIKWAKKLQIIHNFKYTLIELWEEDIKKLGTNYIQETISTALTQNKVNIFH